jgi:hypothetical protein
MSTLRPEEVFVLLWSHQIQIGGDAHARLEPSALLTSALRQGTAPSPPSDASDLVVTARASRPWPGPREGMHV